MSGVNLPNYRVSLVGSGAYAVWVIAESRRAACDLKHVEVLDEYDHEHAA